MAERDETSIEIAAAARAMRERMIRVNAPAARSTSAERAVMARTALNVSTAVAIVVAAAGVPVAKHGNRAASSLAGGADTLEALGLDLDRASARAEESLADLGIAFLFAQKHHPALAKLAPIRKRIGRRTVFNLTGPICNPAGVYTPVDRRGAPDFLPVYAEAIAQLGTESTMLVAGDEPLDELSIGGSSTVIRIGACGEGSSRVTAADAGLSSHPLDAIKGGDAAYNAAALRNLLQGEHSAYRDAVLLNAAAALIVAGEAETLTGGAEEAAEVIDKGLAKALLDCWIAF